MRQHKAGMRQTNATSLLCYRVVFGNSNGLAVVDYLQKTLLLNMGTSELYSPSDPYQRQPCSPRKSRMPSGGEHFNLTFSTAANRLSLFHKASPFRP